MTESTQAAALNHCEPLPAGARLQEYRIEQLLGAGAFGMTYRATDTYLGVDVAVKEFFPEQVARRGAGGGVELLAEEHRSFYEWSLQRFIGEAQVLAQFRHPNIVRVVRYFEAQQTAYIVMEFERGQDLGSVLDRAAGQLTEQRLLDLALPVLDGLQEVHRKRYLHRDIKPGNIFLRDDEVPVLLDFGAAELEMAATNTGKSAILTPGYAPIEQYAANARQGPWTDLYALGATFYRAIAGTTPVQSTRRLSALKIDHPDPLPAAVEVGAGRYSQTLLESVDWMLRVLPTDRPQTAAEVTRRLRSLRRRKDSGVRQAIAKVNHKLIFAGPPGAGTTTAISSLSDTQVVARDAATGVDLARTRPQPAVALDYGMMRVSEEEHIHLYAIPGQAKFSPAWELLGRGAVGLVLLIDNGRDDPLKDLDFFLYAFRNLLSTTRFAIGVTRTDRHPRPTVAGFQHHITEKHAEGLFGRPPVFCVDARERRDVAMLVQAILYAIDPGVQGVVPEA